MRRRMFNICNHPTVPGDSWETIESPHSTCPGACSLFVAVSLDRTDSQLANRYPDHAASATTLARRATRLLLAALCLGLLGCASQPPISGPADVRIASDPGCRELLNQAERWEVQRAEMFLGVDGAPYGVKCVASDGDTVIAMVPSQGNRIAVLAVARGRRAHLDVVERAYGIRIRPGEWQLSRDIDGEAYESSGGMATRANYQAILEEIWKALPRNIRKPLTIP